MGVVGKPNGGKPHGGKPHGEKPHGGKSHGPVPFSNPLGIWTTWWKTTWSSLLLESTWHLDHIVKNHMVQFNTGVHLVTGGTLYQKGGQQKAVSKTALLAVKKTVPNILEDTTMIYLISFAALCDHFEVPHSKKEVKLLIVHFLWYSRDPDL